MGTLHASGAREFTLLGDLGCTLEDKVCITNTIIMAIPNKSGLWFLVSNAEIYRSIETLFVH